jgi:phosphate transport system permease protein
MSVTAQPPITESLIKRKRRTDLFKHPRPFERVIQGILFFCGVVSIFTTVGIIITLGAQAWHFFAADQFIEASRTLATDLTATDTQVVLSSGGLQFREGDVIGITIDPEPQNPDNEVQHEKLLVIHRVDEITFEVQRGYQESPQGVFISGTVVEKVKDVTLLEYFTNTKWQPQIGEVGILPLLSSTLTIALMGMVIATPIGLGTAVYLSEYASPRVRNTLKPILEILAGVPTVVLGYFGLTFITPSLLQPLFGNNVCQPYNILAAGIVVGILVIPTISTISEDALRAVPRALREASYGLGATRFETIIKVLLPAAISGILASMILAVSRAVGETMAVALNAGAGPKIPSYFCDAAETIAGHIVRISSGDLSYQSIDYDSLFSLGLTLFVVTLLLNILSQYVTRRFREVY